MSQCGTPAWHDKALNSAFNTKNKSAPKPWNEMSTGLLFCNFHSESDSFKYLIQVELCSPYLCDRFVSFRKSCGFIVLERKRLGLGDEVQSVRCLQCKHAELSLEYQQPWYMCVYIHSYVYRERERAGIYCNPIMGLGAEKGKKANGP